MESGGGRLSVEVANDRKRFEIELKDGETTVVSWVKLLKDSGIPVDESPSLTQPSERVDNFTIILWLVVLQMDYHLVPRNVPDKRITRSQGNLKTEVTKLESSPKNAK
ncbi:hypothetical protein L1987_19126 [Smallanthus sonchifolius]|uniref:Uncharacterized protein n=1 Tax=Smallanthus sonchifolius TaxID=185202 RepID=A0ACB9J1M2_9ASTR|nr:hypothetical protein L1987_19126 [Smallanthus sonchifolius]